MIPIRAVSQVYDALRQAKAGAPDFCTNCFASRQRLQEWVNHGELWGHFRNGVSFYFRKDRDFHHLYFCAASQTALGQELACLPELKLERLVLDLVGREASLSGLVSLWEAAGFRRYRQLCRMARPSQPTTSPVGDGEAHVGFANPADWQEIMVLLERVFDRYCEQLPTSYEVEAAVEARQILVARNEGKVGGLLFFETQGLTSTLRFWVVAPECRVLRFGSALVRQYFATQTTVRRFVLWVVTNNLDVVQKYRHYGYAHDGLMDWVLANELIPA